MKRLILLCLTLLTIAFLPVFSASAATYDPVVVDIGVEIVNGGTAEIIPQVNCPYPDPQKLTVVDGESGTVRIELEDVGVYSYQFGVVPDERDIIYDTTVYRADIYVTENDGKLYPIVVLYNMQTGKKYDKKDGGEPISVGFANRLDLPTEPTEEATQNTESSEVSTQYKPNESLTGETGAFDEPDKSDGGGRNSRPQTGDDTKMELYLLIAMIASAGLFLLSVAYMRDTNKLIKKE